MPHTRFDVYVPEDLPDLLRYLGESGEGVMVIASGTDLLNRIRRRQVRVKCLVDLSGLSELKYVKRENGQIRIGSLTTLSEMIESGLGSGSLEGFKQLHDNFGAPPIRHMATIGGGVCAASSADDFLPLLLALDAKVKIASLTGERFERIEDFVIDKRIVHLRRGEIVTEVLFDEPGPDAWLDFRKVGMRATLIIAFISAGIYLDLDRSDGRIREVRVAFNRVRRKIPERAKETEHCLKGKILDADLIDEATRVLSQELRLASDYRVSGWYRLEAAKVVFRRALAHCAEMIMGG